MKKLLFAISLLSVISLTGCSKNSVTPTPKVTPTPTPVVTPTPTGSTTIPVTGISLNLSSLELNIGATNTLVATVIPFNASDKNVTWTSSDSSVATVNNGVVTAIKEGVSNITASISSYSATCIVNVKDPNAPVAVTGVYLNYDSANIYVDKSFTLIHTIAPSNATNQEVTWSSSDETIVKVSGGVVTGVSEGSATVTVTTSDGSFTASCLFTVLTKNEQETYVPDASDSEILIIDNDYLPNGNYDSSEDEYTFSITQNYKQIYVNVPDIAVILELNNVTIENNENSPIYVKDCDSIEISAKKNSVNTINDTRPIYTEDDDSQGKGAIYVANGDLKLKGSGTLNVNGGYYNGIYGKDDVKIQKQTLNVTAVNHGIKGNDSVTISSGTINITCGGDGLHTENTDISSKNKQRGNVTINGGTITINSWGDAIAAAYNAIIEEIDASIKLDIKTNKYSSYNGEVVDTSASTLYLKMNSSTYSNGNYTYAAYINGEWYPATYKGSKTAQRRGPGGPGGPGGGGWGQTTYYYYEINKPSNVPSFTLYRYCGKDVTSFSTSNYDAVSDVKAFNDAYDTVEISIRNSKISFSSWSNYADGNDISSKGIKAENLISIISGKVNINSYDDAIHANNEATLDNNTSPLGNVDIAGGELTLYSSDDAIHADYALNISGGYINVTSAYEGLEANIIVMSGGEVYVMATDDGVNATNGKSNASITVSGGYLDVTVPTSGDTDGIDSNGSYSQTGGVVILKGPGSASGNNFGAAALDTDGAVSLSNCTLIIFGGMEKTPSTSLTRTVCSSSTVSTGSHTVSFANSEQTYTTNLKYSTNGCLVYSLLGKATLQ